MPALFIYLIKLSFSLTAVYVFYYLVLRKLTFYTANRWYLLLSTSVCFLLPLFDLQRVVAAKELTRSNMVQLIPAVGDYVKNSYVSNGEKIALPRLYGASYSLWQIGLIVLVLGSLTLLLRLVIRYLSFLQIRKKAHRLNQAGLNLYQVNRPIVPFSFGSAIFINSGRHTEVELGEIVRHELVHVKQHHTIDILWVELVCIFKWYNPVAWLLRHAVRQNLEYIADNTVVQGGCDKKEYQYLLLKVMGGAALPLANQFNFSSLKKRIVMLNRLPSTKAHMMKFLLTLPLIAILLIAFRGKLNKEAAPVTAKKTLTLSGIMVETGTYKPLEDILVKETLTGAEARTDARGFYILDIPVSGYPFEPELTFSKKGYSLYNDYRSIKSEKSKHRFVSIANLEPLGADGKGHGRFTGMGVPTDNIDVNALPTYEEAAAFLPPTLKVWTLETKFRAIREQSDEPYIIVDGHSFVTSNTGYASLREVTDVVFVDGVQMTGEEVNRKVQRSSIKGVGSMNREMAMEKLSINKGVLLLYINTHPEGYLNRHPLLKEKQEEDRLYLQNTSVGNRKKAIRPIN